MQLSLTNFDIFVLIFVSVWAGFGFWFDRSRPHSWRKAGAHALYGITLIIFVFVTEIATRYYVEIYRDAPVKISLQEHASGKEISSVPKEIILTEVQTAQPVISCEGQTDGIACTVSRRAGTCTKDDSGGIFSCYVTPGPAKK